MGLGLLATGIRPAEAAPPSHAPAWGYRRKFEKSNNGGYWQSYRTSRYSRYSRSQDFDRDGVPNWKDRDIDGDGVRNARDRNDYNRHRW